MFLGKEKECDIKDNKIFEAYRILCDVKIKENERKEKTCVCTAAEK